MSTLRRPTATSWSSTARMPFAADSLPPVRHQLLVELAEHDVAPDTRYDVALVLAELVGNALKHARPMPDGGLALRWGYWDGTLHVRVTDGGSATRPRVRRPDTTATGGRGLSIVAALSAEWGVEQQPAATTVWALIAPVTEPAGPHDAE